MERGNKNLRFIDESVGPWLLRVLGPMRKAWRRLSGRSRTPLMAEIKTVGFLKMAGIGDLVLLSAVIADLKKWRPQVKVLLFVSPSNEVYGRLMPQIDEVVVLPVKNPLRAILTLRSRPLDLLFVADSWPRISALLGLFANARWTVGFLTPGQFRHYADDVLVEHRRDRHEIDNYRALLQTLAIPVGSAPQLPAPKPILPAQKNLVLFHFWPGGTKSHLREWPEGHWQKLAELIAREPSEHFGLTGSPEQKVLNQSWINQLPPDLAGRFQNLAGLSLEDSISIIANARCLVTVDTGILHIGAASCIPVVSLHGPSRPERWGGVGPRVYPVRSRLPGAGVLHLGFEYTSDTNFTASITPQEVYQQIVEALNVA